MNKEEQEKILLLQRLSRAKDDIINGRVSTQDEVYNRLQAKIETKRKRT